MLKSPGKIIASGNMWLDLIYVQLHMHIWTDAFGALITYIGVVKLNYSLASIHNICEVILTCDWHLKGSSK